MKLTINGQPYEVSDDNPLRPLLWVLRDELGLMGTRFGCGAGLCGACTVHVNGTATRCCVLPVSAVADATLRTVEGLARREADGTLQLHPVQRAFLQAQVPQCGWCMSGQMMMAAAFLEQNPRPSPEETVEALGRNLCRCGCYARIKKAVLQAAEMMAEEKTP